ncbi:MAG: PA2778 family cysteine peptidase [Betaproteobacteria bacterium]|nr:PA2778 family cysteine peptidase [Betaproteobacteria bacterium]
MNCPSGTVMPDAWYGSARLTAGAFLLLAALSGCASLVPQTMGLRDTWPAGVALRSELAEAPFFPQQEYQCGPAALATALVHAGAQVTPEELVKLVYVPARQGSLQIEMLAASRRYGRVSYRLAPRFDDLLREVAAGNPVIVLQDIGLGPMTQWHYAVVIGFDYPAGELYLRSGETKRLAIPFTVFEYTWKRGDYWAMVAMPPGRIPATASEPGYLAAISAMERTGEARAAISAYSAFLERWPDNITASVALANRHYALGALPEAEAVLRRADARHPDSVVVLNNLAQVLSDLGRNDEALALIERAMRPVDSPFAAVARETHALILQRMGRSR